MFYLERQTGEPLLRNALEHLAADAETQARYVKQLGSWPSLDELALELDDVAKATESWASPMLRERVRELSSTLDQMSGEANAHLWKPEALHTREWAEVRALASRALAALGDGA